MMLLSVLRLLKLMINWFLLWVLVLMLIWVVSRFESFFFRCVILCDLFLVLCGLVVCLVLVWVISFLVLCIDMCLVMIWLVSWIWVVELMVSSVWVWFMLMLLVMSMVCIGLVRFNRCSRLEIVLCECFMVSVVCLCVKVKLVMR